MSAGLVRLHFAACESFWTRSLGTSVNKGTRPRRQGASLEASPNQHVPSLKQKPEQHAVQLLPALHTSLHGVKEGWQQSPDWHTSLLRQALEQVPQWFLEFWRSLQRPSQLVKPSLQTHRPPAQRAPLQQRLPRPHRRPTRLHCASAGSALNIRPPPPRNAATIILSIRPRETRPVAAAAASSSKRSYSTTATCCSSSPGRHTSAISQAAEVS